MSDTRPNPSFLSQSFSVVIIVACFLVFAVILCRSYVPGQANARPVGSVPPAERAARLSELREKNAEVLLNYQWVDQAEGIIRLPIDRAMALTQKELSGKTP